MDKLRQYIREYVMYLYNAKIADADEDYQWKHPSDVDHPIEPYDADNKLPPHYFRHRSVAKPHFENRTPMNKEKLRRIVKEEIKQQFLNESTQEELVIKTLNVLEGLKALKEEAKLFSNTALADPDYEGEAEFMLYYSISEAVKEINKALTRFKRIKR